MIYVIITLIFGLLLYKIRAMKSKPRYKDLKQMEQDEMRQVVFDAIEQVFGVKKDDPKLRDSQDNFYLDLRKIIFANLYPHYGTLTEVGLLLGKKHPAVLNAIRRYGEHYNTDKYFKQKADAVNLIIKKQLNEKS